MSILILPHSDNLGDKRLNPEEALAKLTEENARLVEKLKLPGQAELENQDAAMGNPMPYQELIRRIQLLNHNIICEDGGYPNAIAVRVACPIDDDYPTGKRYVTGFMKEVLPEFSYLVTDKRGLAEKEVRGWRSVLLPLVKQGLISLPDAVKVFGNANGQRADRWEAQTQQFK